MAKISNSFHSSSKKNAVKNLKKLGECQRHNEREYLSESYNGNRIEAVIGSADLYRDTVNYIDSHFKKSIEDYNENQKRADRKIKVSASEYFDGRADTDIANEVIFQFADYEWWSQFRHEYSLVNGQKYMGFDDEVKAVAREIFQEQVQAYQDIYKNHGMEIIEKIKQREIECQQIIQNAKPYYQKIVNEKDKSKKKNMVDFLRNDERKEFNTYTKALHDAETIKKKALLRQDSEGNYELLKSTIHITNQTNHFDEHSIHAHVISVCTTPTAKGLGESISKSRVLNAWTLSTLQDEMRVILERKMELHPEIFEGVELKQKALGRNRDMEKDIYIAKKVEQCEIRALELSHEINQKENLVKSMEQELSKQIEESNQLEAEKSLVVTECNEAKIHLKTLTDKKNSLVNDVKELTDYSIRMRDLEKPIKRPLPTYQLETFDYKKSPLNPLEKPKTAVLVDDVEDYIKNSEAIYKENVELKAKLEASERRCNYLQKQVAKFLKDPVNALNQTLERQISKLKQDLIEANERADSNYRKYSQEYDRAEQQMERANKLGNSLKWYENMYESFIEGIHTLNQKSLETILSWFDDKKQNIIADDLEQYEQSISRSHHHSMER